MHEKTKRLSSLGTLYTYDGRVGDEEELTGALIPADTEICGHNIVLEGCHLDRVRVAAAPHLRMLKSRLNVVDAANADFDQCGWKGVTIAESRFTGAKLNGSVLTDVTFTESRLNLAQVQNCKMKNIRFEQCDLRGAYFNGSSMPGTLFEGSNLTGVDFSGADISGSDLRRAIIEDIRIAPDQLQKVIVTSDQALYLARLFGLDVRE